MSFDLAYMGGRGGQPLGMSGSMLRTPATTESMERRITDGLRRDFAQFQQYTVPTLERLEQQMNGTEVIDAALEDSAQYRQRREGRDTRMLARLGMGASSPQQREAFKRQRLRDLAAQTADTQNTARQTQMELNDQRALAYGNLAAGIYGIGREMEQSAYADFKGVDRANQDARNAYRTSNRALGTNILGAGLSAVLGG